MRAAAGIASVLLATLVLAVPAQAASPTGGSAYVEPAAPSGAASPSTPVTPLDPVAPGSTATLTADGRAVAPPGAPLAVRRLIAAGNRIARLPYRWGGGHGRFRDTGYDCSGSVSYVLHAARLLDTTLDSTGLARWGEAGAGRWITVYANRDHAFLTVAGIRFDTGGQQQAGSRWQPLVRSTDRFRVRHPAGL
jgi:cell wall-associated NlpC family hydrolase